VRCRRCGAASTEPWPSAAALDAAYGTWYRPASGRFSGPGDAILRRTRGRLARRLNRIAPPGPVLDIGAGDGALLDALAAVGREALGLERRATRPDVRAASLAELDGQWAAIVFWHSLEHMPDPRAQLERAARLLMRGGVLVVAVPNASSLQARVFGDRWLALDLPRHLVHLPAPLVLETLRSLSVSIERVSSWRGGQVFFGWLHGLIAALPGHPDLYDAVRRPEARRRERSGPQRLVVLAAAAALAPLAVAGAAAEIALGRGGTLYVEGTRG
jgi:SAM-dependent methyltransferase